MSHCTLENGVYRHYKNGFDYEVIGCASLKEEDGYIPLVLYRALSEKIVSDTVWAAPVSRFTEVMRDGEGNILGRRFDNGKLRPPEEVP